MNHVCFSRATRSVLWLPVLIGLTPLVWAAPPKVIKAVPDNGETKVDPDLRFIRVEFDQDMTEGSHSWVSGGESFPKTRTLPYWEGPRSAVLPVELEPEHDYWLSINSHTYGNFQSKTGGSARPYPIAFRTGPAKPGRDLAAIIAAENKASGPVLRRTIERYYSYLEVRKVDWDKAFTEFTPRLEAAGTPEQFAKQAGRLLAKAEDVHISLKYGRFSFPSYVREVPPNCNKQTLRGVIPNWKKRSRPVATGRFEDGLGYIVIASWERKYAEDLKVLYQALEQLSDTRALIIDVRLNAGGDEALAQAFAGCFIDKPVVYAQQVYRQPDAPGGFSPPQQRVLQPTKGKPRYRGRVAVLMGRHNMSSCEGFLLMMKQVPGCQLVGEQTYGSSGNPQPHGLPNGVKVFLPSWKAMTPDGVFFEGIGLAADVPVKARPQDFEKGDPVLEAALQLLREHESGNSRPHSARR
ncbi:MAG: S41 family peptidase [Phycisphaerae bacterium]|nr:S41 family peptidase [Phycisphaerae bacterium]